jgi:ParB/RepB/Spo0J family partition protein
MHTHRTQQRIASLPLHKLHPHPDNANRMSKAKFNMLIRHIETTGQYEPLVVRKHPTQENAWQILNGHHRLRALRQLKHSRADCVVFAADDAQARLYLLNLNRLVGRDNVYKKAKLIEQLCRTHTPRDLAKRLSDSKTSIEKLNALSQNQPLPKTKEKPLLLPMTFFMTEAQHALVTAAFDKANGENTNSGRSQKRLNALCRMAEDCLAKERFNILFLCFLKKS